ncbi:uncharacterized protein LY79DRAFT_246889 [Colletotrichum navitas]|uniref:Uncharacterized protein n=1 Tax=Colletotrichum navitas TaxID=681940 RepID=A0AAD8QC11_9PEZI|nr:uncharacterized protein LY79DRAFT_246889 [Colletotrichum navitas]KAK1598528.1 hypothetical protein LY79DRAFT_246889 [Colletotrichum navitas]
MTQSRGTQGATDLTHQMWFLIVVFKSSTSLPPPPPLLSFPPAMHSWYPRLVLCHIPLDSVCVCGKSSVDRPAEIPKLDKHKKKKRIRKKEKNYAGVLFGGEGGMEKTDIGNCHLSKQPSPRGEKSPREKPVYQIPPAVHKLPGPKRWRTRKRPQGVQRWPNSRFLARPCPNSQDLLPTFPFQYSRSEDALLDYTFRFMVVKYVRLQSARVAVSFAS